MKNFFKFLMTLFNIIFFILNFDLKTVNIIYEDPYVKERLAIVNRKVGLISPYIVSSRKTFGQDVYDEFKLVPYSRWPWNRKFQLVDENKRVLLSLKSSGYIVSGPSKEKDNEYWILEKGDSGKYKIMQDGKCMTMTVPRSNYCDDSNFHENIFDVPGFVIRLMKCEESGYLKDKQLFKVQKAKDAREDF